MEAAELVTAVPLNSSARQSHLNKRTRRAGGRHFRVGPKAEISSDRNQLARALVEPDFYFLFLKINDKPLVRFGRRKQIGPIYVRPARWGVRQGERKLPLFLTLFIPDPNDSGYAAWHAV